MSEDEVLLALKKRGFGFLMSAWEGVPQETEEVAPKWFKKDDVPLDALWADGGYWLPLLLEGMRFTADFLYDATNERIDAYDVSFVL